MNRINSMIQSAATAGGVKKFLSAYVMPGYPHKDSTLRVLKAAEVAGTDFVELGIPFSDPLADGPVIQQAAQTAIQNGMTPRGILEIVSEFRKSSQMPVILMGYINSFMNGIGKDFAARIADAGADGVIIPDLSLEEAGNTRKEIEQADLSMVLLIAPTSDDSRIHEIDSASTDFSYCVSVAGVTGTTKDLMSGDVSSFLARVKRIARKPFVVGFGISTPEVARDISGMSDGVVVGSALLQRISSAQRGEEAASTHTFLSTLRAAIDK